MKPSSRTPEGEPNRCPICGHEVTLEPTTPPGDAPCPYCGSLLWFPALPAFEVFEFVACQTNLADFNVTTKEAALKTLVHNLSKGGFIGKDFEQEVTAAVLQREQLGSTGIGRGIAIPHAKHVSVPGLLGAIGHIPRGIDFQSLDGKPVTLVFMILSSPDEPGELLQAVERASRYLCNAA